MSELSPQEFSTLTRQDTPTLIESTGSKTISATGKEYFYGNKYFQDLPRVDTRLLPQNGKTFRIGKLWEIHHEIARRLSLGEKNRDIANALGITEVMVSYTKNSKLVEDKVDILRASMDADTIDLGVRIKEFAPKALVLLEEIIEGKHDEASIALRARYADRHLDRAGLAPIKKIAVATGHLSRNDIEEIKRRATGAAVKSGVVDITQATKGCQEQRLHIREADAFNESSDPSPTSGEGDKVMEV